MSDQAAVPKLYRPGMIGCTDGGCIFQDNTKGMHTNGGCNCARELQRLKPQGFNAVLLIDYLRNQLREVKFAPAIAAGAEPLSDGRVMVPIKINGRVLYAMCPDASTLTASGADIKALSGSAETYLLFKGHCGECVHELISDGQAVVLTINPILEFYTTPQAHM